MVAKGINSVIEYFTGVDLIAQGQKLATSLYDGVTSSDFVTAITSAVSGWWTSFEQLWDSFSGMVRGFGQRAVDWILEGLKERWTAVVEWLRSTMSSLTSWLPESIQARLGVSLDNGPLASGAKAGGAAIGSMVTPPPPISIPGFRDYGAKVQSDSGTVGSSQPVSIPENIILREPKMVNAPVNVSTSVTVNATTNAYPAAIAAAAADAVNANVRRAVADQTSSLSD